MAILMNKLRVFNTEIKRKMGTPSLLNFIQNSIALCFFNTEIKKKTRTQSLLNYI